MQKVVITGATSMLGVALIQECIASNMEVLAIVRKNSKYIDRIPKVNSVRVQECNLDELSSVHKNEIPYDTFYHFAWDYTDRERRDNPVYQELNIKYTLEAVELANRMGCRTFIGAGSQAEYGRATEKIGPNTAINPDIAYGVAKYAAGKLSQKLCFQLGIKHIWTRIFSVYGPNDNSGTMVMYAINSLLRGEIPLFTKSEQKWDYLYCKDAGRAFRLIGEYGKTGQTYCLGSGHQRRMREYIEILRDSINPKLEISIGGLEYSENQVMSLCADIDSLKEDTGFTPRYSFEDGIMETVEWFRKENHL